MAEKRFLWKLFPGLTKMVWEDHQKRLIVVGGGHDFFHALLVAQYGLIIAEKRHIGVLAWVAGICHNTDRIFSKNRVEKRIWEYLNSGTNFSEQDKRLIIEAVLHHDELNKPNDNLVTVILKDADRLAGVGALCPIRASQHFPILPIFNPKYIKVFTLGATFQDPKTILDCLKFTLEWQLMLRCPKAIELGEEYFGILRKLIKDLESQLKKAGLDAFIFPS